jgi:hypothetical protein
MHIKHKMQLQFAMILVICMTVFVTSISRQLNAQTLPNKLNSDKPSEDITARKVVVDDPCIDVVAGAALLIPGALGKAAGTVLSPFACTLSSAFTNSIGEYNKWHIYGTRDYFMRLWVNYMPSLKSEKDVEQVRTLLTSASVLAQEKFYQYVSKNKLDWCGSKYNFDCQPDFSNIKLSQVVGSRRLAKYDATPAAQQISFWEISADLVFPVDFNSEESKRNSIERVAIELLRQVSSELPNMRRDLNSKFLVGHDDLETAKTKLSYAVMGLNLPKFFGMVTIGADRHPNPSLPGPMPVMAEMDFSKDYMNYRVMAIPSSLYKIIQKGSAADRAVTDDCSANKINERIDSSERKNLFLQSQKKAQDYLRNFAKGHKMHLCVNKDDPSCLGTDDILEVYDVQTITRKHQYDGSWEWRLPAKMFCSYNSSQKQAFIDYIALELIRVVPTYSEILNKEASILRTINNLSCDDSANTLLAWNIAGWNPVVDSNFKKTLSTICGGKPLKPPGYQPEKAYQVDGMRYLTAPQKLYNDYPFWMSCGPSNLQDLFFAELPKCETLNLSEVKQAVAGLQGSLDTSFESRKTVHTFFNIGVSLALWNLLDKVWRSKIMIYGHVLDSKTKQALIKEWSVEIGNKLAAKEMAQIIAANAVKTVRFGSPTKFIVTMVGSAAVQFYLNPNTYDVEAEPVHLLPEGLINRVFNDDLAAREELAQILFNWRQESDSEALTTNDPRLKEFINSKNFNSILHYLSSHRIGRAFLRDSKTF